MNIEHKIRLEDVLGGAHARIIVDVFADGVDCGSVVVASGPKNDVLEMFHGDIIMAELQERWKPKVRIKLTPDVVHAEEEEQYVSGRRLQRS